MQCAPGHRQGGHTLRMLLCYLFSYANRPLADRNLAEGEQAQIAATRDTVSSRRERSRTSGLVTLSLRPPAPPTKGGLDSLCRGFCGDSNHTLFCKMAEWRLQASVR